MGSRTLTWLTRPALLRTLWAQGRLATRLLREPRVPASVKALIALPALYILSPLDLLPDLMPGIGQLDDLGVLILALQWFVGAAPADAVRFHRDAIQARRPYAPMSPTDVVIEADWRRG